MEWRFKQLTPNDTLQNASHLEFFHNEALQSTVDALAREDIQNRLDARGRNEARVEVRYRFCGPVVADSHQQWFQGLDGHLAAPQIAEELGLTPSLKQPLTWLVIEDFGTTGLEGDPAQFQDSASGNQRNDFFWFIRNVGRSGKKGGDRGRWGLGKIVYPAASQVRSIFAYTVRRSDQRRLLIGRSVLAVHEIDGNQHDSEGYFGRFDDGDHEYFATPETELTVVDRFASDFDVSRQADQPGLSLVIPWPEKDITPDALIRSLVEHWFWVFLEDRLVVTVSIPALGEEVLLSKDTIEDVIRQRAGETSLEAQQLLRKLRFAQEIQQFDIRSPNYYALAANPSGSAPKWDNAEERFASPDVLNSARETYRAGSLLAFDVPVKVKRKDKTVDEEASFQIYVQHTEGGEQAVETFLRDGLTISGQRFLRETGTIAFVMAEDNVLGTLLGDAENPAHTRWERSGKHFRGRYENGPSILSFVQRSALHLCSLLSRKPDGVDKDLLKHLFNVVEPGESTSTGPKPGKGKPAKPVVPELNKKNYFVECNKIPGGFHVRPHPKATVPPAAIQLRAAYEVARGNAFRLHHPADFDLAKRVASAFQLKGLEVTRAEPNRLVFSVIQPDFEMTATGFDQRRDLIVEVRPLHSPTADEATRAEVPRDDENGADV